MTLNKMVGKGAGATLSALLVLSMVTAGIPVVYGQDDQRATVDQLIGILTNAGEHIEASFRLLEGRGVNIPDAARNSYQEGLTIAQQAVGLRDQGQLQEAKAKAVEASQKFREAALAIAGDLQETQTDDEAESERARGILEAIDAISATVTRLEGLASNVEGLGYGLQASDITTRLDNVKQLLAQVRSSVGEGEIEQAEQGLGQAQSEVETAAQGFGPVARSERSKLASSFLADVENRTSAIGDRVLATLSNLPIPDIAKQAIIRAITNANDRISTIRTLLQQGNTDEAVSELRQTGADVQDILGNLRARNPAVADGYSDAFDQEDAIKALDRRADALQRAGVDADEIKAKLNDAKAKISEAMEKLKEGDAAVNDILAEVQSIIDDAQAQLDRLEGF